MKRKALMVALALGTIGGFTWGVASLGCHAHRHQARWHSHLRQQVTEICTEAVRQARQEEGRAGRSPSPEPVGPTR
jgi:hypothetical protein